MSHPGREGGETMNKTVTISYVTFQRMIAIIDNYQNELRERLLDLERQEKESESEGPFVAERLASDLHYIEKVAHEALREVGV